MDSNPPRQRLALGHTPRRLSFERRLRISLALLGLPCLALAVVTLRVLRVSPGTLAFWLVLLFLGWAFACSLVLEQVTRPLQTLANVIAALREDDYSFRARGGRRNDAVGDLAMEVNALAGLLQARRSNALEAMALVERVITAMQSPVLAFAPDGRLRLLNAAAEQAFALEARKSSGRLASELRLTHLMAIGDDELLSTENSQGSSRWIVKRSTFRLRGVPHILIVLSEVSAALREEERQAWQRLIRVMSHEINNSLTPIKSIASSLRAQSRERLAHRGEQPLSTQEHDWERGLGVIEDRAESLNRFLQAYGQLARLPLPRRTEIDLGALAERVCRLETRLAVTLSSGPSLTLCVDEDQLQQALINLVKNAADAGLANSTGTHTSPWVQVSWRLLPPDVVITVEDNGAGIANESNMFVPFYTTKPGGTGIGLVLALQIIEAHGGTVRLRNRVGAPGCVAELRLPVPALERRGEAAVAGA